MSGKPKSEKYEVFLDGDSWTATGDGFIDLATSKAGFGTSPLGALGDLLVAEEEKRTG